MKILFTGGGSGGHFYPIIAIAESIKKIAKENKFIPPKLYFFSTNPYNEGILFDHQIEYKKIIAGKMRRYFSIKNFFDLWKTLWGIINAFFDLFDVFPDVVFGKGGYASFPTLVAARILRIPVFIHESDAIPGRVNKWAGKFASRIAVSYKEAEHFFPKDKVAHTGQPIMQQKLEPITEGAFEWFEFEKSVPTIFIMGGSQGSETINNIILDSLEDLLPSFQIIHQVGPKNLEIIKQSASAILLDSKYKKRYRPFAYMNDLEIKMASGASTIVISRAGSTIFEIASWGKPSIIIPINEEISHDQTKNAFTYAKSGACSVIEEENLKTHIFISEIRRITENKDLYTKMSESAKKFFVPNASDNIARELLKMVISHQKPE